MTQLLRRAAFVALVGLPVLAGCASDGCDYLVYEDGEEPRMAQPLVIPEGVPAPADSGQFSVPPSRADRAPAGCAARPPMTLSNEVLNPPAEEADGGSNPEAGGQ